MEVRRRRRAWKRATARGQAPPHEAGTAARGRRARTPVPAALPADAGARRPGPVPPRVAGAPASPAARPCPPDVLRGDAAGRRAGGVRRGRPGRPQGRAQRGDPGARRSARPAGPGGGAEPPDGADHAPVDQSSVRSGFDVGPADTPGSRLSSPLSKGSRRGQEQPQRDRRAPRPGSRGLARRRDRDRSPRLGQPRRGRQRSGARRRRQRQRQCRAHGDGPLPRGRSGAARPPAHPLRRGGAGSVRQPALRPDAVRLPARPNPRGRQHGHDRVPQQQHAERAFGGRPPGPAGHGRPRPRGGHLHGSGCRAVAESVRQSTTCRSSTPASRRS